jgi:hypothetical protein
MTGLKPGVDEVWATTTVVDGDREARIPQFPNSSPITRQPEINLAWGRNCLASSRYLAICGFANDPPPTGP